MEPKDEEAVKRLASELAKEDDAMKEATRKAQEIVSLDERAEGNQ